MVFVSHLESLAWINFNNEALNYSTICNFTHMGTLQRRNAYIIPGYAHILMTANIIVQTKIFQYYNSLYSTADVGY